MIDTRVLEPAPADRTWLDDASAALLAYAQLPAGDAFARRAAARRLLASPNIRPVLRRAAFTPSTRDAVLEIARVDVEDHLDQPWTERAEAWMELTQSSWQESAQFCADLAWSGRQTGSSTLTHLTADQALSCAPTITARTRLHLYGLGLRYDFRCGALRVLFARRGHVADLDPFSRSLHAFALLGQSDPAATDLIDPLLEESQNHPKIAHTLLHGLWLGHDLPDQPHLILALLDRPAFADADTDAIALFRKAAALRGLRRFDEALAAIAQAMEVLPVNAGSAVHSDLVRERALILSARDA
ncbi:hypothetical protein [Streptomyces sp. RKAG337]|uniref:hypothetical protein n=1 Tax=Streptomyces sp. RKAG337 TaxID=2893404 RepID=UPI002033B7E6|nr:hypothetical protein [Streptomyces sp. RKAG337]MCM2430991.1 hypothetical protein [Streptomyces sp. RKAG337]